MLTNPAPRDADLSRSWVHPRFVLLAITAALYAMSFALPWWLERGTWASGRTGLEVFNECMEAGFYYFLAPIALGFNLPVWCAACCLLVNWRWPAAGFACIGIAGAVYLTRFGPLGSSMTFGPGYFVWVASMVPIVLAPWIGRGRGKAVGVGL